MEHCIPHPKLIVSNVKVQPDDQTHHIVKQECHSDEFKLLCKGPRYSPNTFAKKYCL